MYAIIGVYPSSCTTWLSGVLARGAILVGLLPPPVGGFLSQLCTMRGHELQDLALSVGSLLLHPLHRGYGP